jgi:hypothetical protein
MAVTTPVRATAAPCSSWHANSDLPVLNLSTGHTVTLDLNVGGTQFTDNNPDAILQAPNGDRYDGNAQGLVAGGNGRIDFTVIWTPQAGEFGGPSRLSQQITSHFTGEIAADGTARGSAVDNKNAHVDWATAPGAYSCADAPPKADDQPAPNEPAPEANPPLNCDDPAVFDANKFFCGMAKNLVEGPTDAVTMNINVGFGNADVDIASSASIPGTCHYDATAPLLPGVHKTFDLAANGSTSFSTLSPPPLSTYHVVLSCKGQFNGKTVEFGHVEQDVTAAG